MAPKTLSLTRSLVAFGAAGRGPAFPPVSLEEPWWVSSLSGQRLALEPSLEQPQLTASPFWSLWVMAHPATPECPVWLAWWERRARGRGGTYCLRPWPGWVLCPLLPWAPSPQDGHSPGHSLSTACTSLPRGNRDLFLAQVPSWQAEPIQSLSPPWGGQPRCLCRPDGSSPEGCTRLMEP